MSIMKTPCEHCPYRHDVKPFLHAKRGEELAYHAQNPYNSFSCHKTLGHDDEGDGDTIVTEKSKECAGFVTLQINEGMDVPEGFTPAFEMVYSDAWEMSDAYEEAWKRGSKLPKI